MTAVAFDTHAAVTALRKAGFDEPQAEAAAAMVRDAVTEGVATKGDTVRLHTKIEAVETKMDAGFAALKWVAGIVAALTAGHRRASVRGHLGRSRPGRDAVDRPGGPGGDLPDPVHP